MSVLTGRMRLCCKGVHMGLCLLPRAFGALDTLLDMYYT